MSGDSDLSGHFSDGAPGLVHAAFRYYLGRQTIAAAQFAEDLAKAWPLLPASFAGLIREELDRKFLMDDEARERGVDFMLRPLGMDCDRVAWEKVRAAYQTTE